MFANLQMKAFCTIKKRLPNSQQNYTLLKFTKLLSFGYATAKCTGSDDKQEPIKTVSQVIYTWDKLNFKKT